MVFVVEDDRLYYVESSDSYKEIATKGVEMCEYVELKEGRVLFVEAKKTAPNPQSQVDNAENIFNEYITSICNKFVNAAMMLNTGVVERRKDIRSEIPDTFTLQTIQQYNYTCLLVIKDHEIAWLPPVQDALKREFSRTPFWNIWSNYKVQVINEELARNKHIIK